MVDVQVFLERHLIVCMDIMQFRQQSQVQMLPLLTLK